MSRAWDTLATLWHYQRTRHLRFDSRAALQAHQERQLLRFQHDTLPHSAYFRPFIGLPLSQWPLMDKALMMAEFDQMNTAGLKRDELLACALQAEHSRDFSRLAGHFSPGLSSGTSGRRGLFVASPAERRLWAGAILARLLPRGLLAGERVALFLRADNSLYQGVNSRWLTLEFFDLFAPLAEQYDRLSAYRPSIIVAPAQVLSALTQAMDAGQLRMAPHMVVSVAEVLEPQERDALRQRFPRVAEVYQATEGFLGATCKHGALHLNEEFIHVEPEWLDERRFLPIITDFTRRTQPIVRYRLDDILTLRDTPCPCGRVTLALSAIEGRHDDQLQLPGRAGGSVTLFADLCSRALALSLPLHADYRLWQQGEGSLSLHADCPPEALQRSQIALQALFERHGVDLARLRWTLHNTVPPQAPHEKRRRIRRLPGTPAMASTERP
ncbi:F390 synthetase-related protein [Kerstersia sp.]|uniref:F390 synthetase-related protein n=1 Tax=Kerstersia sp. TaxID=1930783 RepID=UPI003F91CAFD